MSRTPHHLFDRDPSLSSIHDSMDSFEAEVYNCHQHPRRQRQHDAFDLKGFFSPRSGSPLCSCCSPPPESSSRLRRQEREIASLKYEVEALKHMFIERSSQMLRMELALEKAVRQLAAETDRLEERRKQLSFAEARFSERTHHASPPGELLTSGNSTCVFPTPARSASKSPGDFSFSNKEADETTMFSFGEIDENIEVLRAYTAKYPHDSMEEEPKPRNLDLHEVILLPHIYAPRRTGCEQSKSYQILLGECIAERYRIDAIIASTNFSTVLSCFDVQTKTDVCVKVLHNQKEVLDQGLDEIKVWKFLESQCGDQLREKRLAHLLDFFYYREHLFIVSELLGENLYVIYSSPETKSLLTVDSVRRITVQLLTALECIHGLGLIHADVKPENILLKSSVRKLSRRPKTLDIVLADFGSSCFLTDELTTYIQSQAYRAPEVIVGAEYSTKIDIWSVGCVVAELLTGEVLLPATSPEESLFKVSITQIWKVLGELPTVGRLLPNYIKDGKLLAQVEASEEIQRFDDLFADSLLSDFLRQLLRVDPEERPTASEALKHEWLNTA